MQKLNNISLKSMVLIAFVAGVLMGGGALFYLNYSPPAQADDQIEFKAEAYKDLVRFQATGGSVSKVQVEIYDLSGREVYQGESTSQVLDWYRNSASGERLTKGTYLYVTKAYSNGSLAKTSGIGKMYISPDSVNLQSAPSLKNVGSTNKQAGTSENNITPLDYDQTPSDGHFDIDGQLFIGTDSPVGPSKDMVISEGSLANRPGFSLEDRNTGDYYQFLLRDTAGDGSGSTESRMNIYNSSRGSWFDFLQAVYPDSGSPIVNFPEGRVGISTASPQATLEIHGSESNLLALYDPEQSTTSAKFRVEKDGDVRADGTYYGADFVSNGGADVAERINTSEWVEKGSVVEIDPSHEGFFRKARGSYSTRVAGVISTNPGVILGNDEKSKWEDNRPLLALAGRVPVKVTTENGDINTGDLLVSSSRPGYAMKCSTHSKCTGAIIGKAMEPFTEKTGTVMAQVSLG